METKKYEKQLNIKEVRIGNVVYGSWDDQDEDGEDITRYSLCKVTGVDENGELGEGWSYMLENMDQPQTDYYGGLYGVELTEEWLLSLGFEKRDDDKYYHHKYDRTWVKIESCIVKWYGNAVGVLVMIDYVHQLQNCFHVFTGEELTIKEQL